MVLDDHYGEEVGVSDELCAEGLSLSGIRVIPGYYGGRQQPCLIAQLHAKLTTQNEQALVSTLTGFMARCTETPGVTSALEALEHLPIAEQAAACESCRIFHDDQLFNRAKAREHTAGKP